jgi:hypothetical protein
MKNIENLYTCDVGMSEEPISSYTFLEYVLGVIPNISNLLRIYLPLAQPKSTSKGEAVVVFTNKAVLRPFGATLMDVPV